MAGVDPLLAQLLRERIEPSAARIERAIGSHSYLRAQLDTGHFANRIESSYLSGSYSRDTAIHPLDDVDVIFVVDPSAWRHSIFEKFFSAVPKPHPKVILESFAAAVRSRYQRSSVFLQRRSVRLDLAHLSLDVVPAVADASPNFIWIPDRKKENWIKSAPLVHKANGEEINRMRDGLYKPLVKLLKFWNSNLPETAKLKSFTIETIAARIFHTYPMASLEEGLAKFFDFILWRLGGTQRFRWRSDCAVATSGGLVVPDTAGTGGNVAAGVNRERLARFAAQVRLGQKRLSEAVAAATMAGTTSRLHALFRH